MASKPKTEAPADDEDEKEEGEAKEEAPKKAGLAGRILGPVLAIPRLLNPLAFLKLPLMKKLIVGGGTLGVLLLAGAAYYFLAPGPEKNPEEAAAENVQTKPANLPPAEAAFFDIPDIIVNIQTPDASPAFLKLSVSLELRVEDVRGSAGVMRLKEELLRRVNLAVAPTPVRDVLLKEMIVQ